MIEVEDAAVSLGGVEVLEGVSLRVDTGEFVGLVGPNGAGKTTLLRTVNGAIDPDAGTVRVDGASMRDLSSKAGSRRVATVPQDTTVRFAFSVEDVVAMGRTPHRERFGAGEDPREYVDRALERTDTESLRDRRISTLSGGERQRVFVARALAQDTPALVLDEPTASLDINHAARTLSLVRELVDENRAVLAAIHDLEAAARYCDRLVMLADGQVAAAGTPEEVLTETALAETFDTRSVVTDHPVTGSPTVTPVDGDDADGPTVHVLGGGPLGARTVAQLHAAGATVTAGPSPESDALVTVADRLGVPVETVPPLAGMDERTRQSTRDRIQAADVTVLVDHPRSATDRLRSLAHQASRLAVVTEEIPERGEDGDQKGRRSRRLRERAVETSVDSVAETVGQIADEPPLTVDRRGV